MPLERFSAAWREAYVREASAAERSGNAPECVFCDLLGQGVGAESGVITTSQHAFVTLNAYPYGSGHLLVLPRRHIQSLGEMTVDESHDYFDLLRRTTQAVTEAYQPDGMNVGFNLGRAAGAGIPQHLHGHVLPRWNGDTNFMTSLGETRVLPESLATTWAKVATEFAK